MRILAVTADASLITALTSMMLDWEIVHVRDPAEAKPKSEGAVISLIDSGTTPKGVETAKILWNSGVTLPSLVIGDMDPEPGTRVRVLVRPFNLQDLTGAVEEVSQALPVDPGLAAAADVEADTETELGAEPEVEPEPAQALEPEGVIDTEPPAVAQAEPAVETVSEPAEPEPEVEAPTSETSLKPSPYAELEELREPTPEAVSEEATAPVAPPEALQPQTQATAPQRPPLVVSQPAAKPEAGRKRFRRREQAAAKQQEPASEDPTLTRLRQAIVSARELEALVHELPVLAQPRAMAHAFLGEVVEMFGPQIAAVFAPGFDGAFGVIAAHGLSSVEASMKVPSDQALFLEIAQTMEAVLIAPVDLAQGLVAGIGGARTEALMAAPLAVGGVCHAIVVVGRPDFSEFDLDLLAEQAEEAAPGLALAQIIDRLRGL